MVPQIALICNISTARLVKCFVLDNKKQLKIFELISTIMLKGKIKLDTK